jgi:hypothetical protein
MLFSERWPADQFSTQLLAGIKPISRLDSRRTFKRILGRFESVQLDIA